MPPGGLKLQNMGAFRNGGCRHETLPLVYSGGGCIQGPEAGEPEMVPCPVQAKFHEVFRNTAPAITWRDIDMAQPCDMRVVNIRIAHDTGHSGKLEASLGFSPRGEHALARRVETALAGIPSLYETGHKIIPLFIRFPREGPESEGQDVGYLATDHDEVFRNVDHETIGSFSG